MKIDLRGDSGGGNNSSNGTYQFVDPADARQLAKEIGIGQECCKYMQCTSYVRCAVTIDIIHDIHKNTPTHSELRA